MSVAGELVEREQTMDLAVVREVEREEQLARANLFGTSDPEAFLARATSHAVALMRVVGEQKLSNKISGRDYLRVEAWTLIGALVGVFPVVTETRELADGWWAHAEARTRSGEVLGGADAICTRSEKAWKDRDSYALLGMAQTRAVSRCLRGPLDFIAKLAGFEATPAEEVPEDEEKPKRQAGSTTTARKTSGGGGPAASAPTPDDGWETMAERLRKLRDRNLIDAFFERSGYQRLTHEMWSALNPAMRQALADHAAAAEAGTPG